MNEEILINVTPQETRVALVQQGAVQELHVERTLSRGRVGNVYLGKVVRVLPGMQSAFIDIGLERAAFLHVADIWHPRLAGEPQHQAPHQPIEKIVFEGQTLMVQVVKDPIGTKGARLSTQVSIAGRTLVYLPQEPHIGISQKIESEAEREAIRARLTAVLPADEKGGYIVRTIAEDATSEELAGDVAYLRKTWATILSQGQRMPPTSLLYQDLNLAQRVLRDFVNDETSRIQVDSRETFQMLSDFAAEFTPAVLSKLHHYTGERPLFDLYNIETEIQRALSRRVDLKSGGYLVIDQTEAMTTIDVNTGGYRRRAQFRRYDLQDQPRSRAYDCTAIAAAQSGRRDHHRLHRHGERRASRPGAGRVEEGVVTRSHAGDGEWVLAAWARGDDAQADSRVAGARVV